MFYAVYHRSARGVNDRSNLQVQSADTLEELTELIHEGVNEVMVMKVTETECGYEPVLRTVEKYPFTVHFVKRFLEPMQ